VNPVNNKAQYGQTLIDDQHYKQREVESGFENKAYDGSSGTKGEVQPKRFNDVGFAIAFLVHIVFMIGFMIFVPVVAEEGENGGDYDAANIDYQGLWTCIGICSGFAVVLSTFMLTFMMKFANQLVKMALIFTIIMSGVIVILGAMFGQTMLVLFGLLQFFVGICYARVVWHRIPFAAANLNTSLAAVKSNLGLMVVGYFFTSLAMIWTARWMMSVNVALAYFGQGSLFFLFLSYFWTHQVIQNTVHVTTAGVVGTWWFNPLEASSFCSSAIRDSFVRASTFSFGSICFGSLIVAVVQALRQLNYQARNQDDCQILVCITDCILACIEGIIEYLNKWAYVYVGLYGYSYIDAGKNVMTLLKNKGWDVIITDNLVDNVLLMVSFVIGLVTGLVGLIVAGIDQNLLADLGYENVELVGFGVGFLTGFVFSSIMMSIVGSAVNTVIVCYAEAPNEFHNNHPFLSNEMRVAWRSAWPDVCGSL